jgi:chemotaxis protein MotB
MARRRRRHQHEEHANHEAWAIPYGDLVTLLLAFFVVMYAVSSLNEGKYRVLSDSLFAAFRGSPRTLDPVQVGEKQSGSGGEVRIVAQQQAVLQHQPHQLVDPPPFAARETAVADTNQAPEAASDAMGRQLDGLAQDVATAMRELIDDNLLTVRRQGATVEVEIRTDILFSSGEATLAPAAGDILRQICGSLKPFPNPIRVEGHTDNRPISTAAYPSNWELSSARAASVVHLFTESGIDPRRLAVIGLGEFRPAQSNDTAEGRNANRRVVLVILGSERAPEGNYADERARTERALDQGNPAVNSNDAAPAAPAVAPAVQTATE